MPVFAVTGGASGLGAATAAAALLGERGHVVVGVDRRPADLAADLGIDTPLTDAMLRTRDWPAVGELVGADA